jgi:hypothetical protein
VAIAAQTEPSLTVGLLPRSAAASRKARAVCAGAVARPSGRAPSLSQLRAQEQAPELTRLVAQQTLTLPVFAKSQVLRRQSHSPPTGKRH